jgi:hypothetical protein
MQQVASKNKYIVGNLERFDQKYVMYNRVRWDPEVEELGRKLYGILSPRDKPGYSLVDRALQNSFWYVEMAFAHGHIVHGKDLFSWKKIPYSDCLRLPKGEKLESPDPADMALKVKKAAKGLGADMVGICELDQRWIYSDWYNLL